MPLNVHDINSPTDLLNSPLQQPFSPSCYKHTRARAPKITSPSRQGTSVKELFPSSTKNKSRLQYQQRALSREKKKIQLYNPVHDSCGTHHQQPSVPFLTPHIYQPYSLTKRIKSHATPPITACVSARWPDNCGRFEVCLRPDGTRKHR